LQTSPGNWDLLSAQGLNSYVTFPKDSLPKIYTLNVTETATYVTVMDLVTVNQDEVFWIGRKNLQQETGLGREGFKSGLKGCHKKRLFKYAKYGAMEVFDPKTASRAIVGVSHRDSSTGIMKPRTATLTLTPLRRNKEPSKFPSMSASAYLVLQKKTGSTILPAPLLTADTMLSAFRSPLIATGATVAATRIRSSGGRTNAMESVSQQNAVNLGKGSCAS